MFITRRGKVSKLYIHFTVTYIICLTEKMGRTETDADEQLQKSRYPYNYILTPVKFPIIILDNNN